MPYPSLLYWEAPASPPLRAGLLEDLKLTALVPEAVRPALLTPLPPAGILARQALFRRLEEPAVLDHFTRLARDMEQVRRCHESFSAARCDNERVLAYLSLVSALTSFYRTAVAAVSAGAGDNADLYGRFTSYFAGEVQKPAFLALTQAIDGLYPRIADMQDNLLRVRGSRLTVSPQSPPAFEERLARCARELGFGAFSPSRSFSHALLPQVIDAIASLYPEQFKAFHAFYARFRDFFDPAVLSYHMETAFYLELTGLFGRIREAGIPLTYPRIAADKRMDIRDAYDITLLSKDVQNIVPNDVLFDESEPFFYLTGANGGGKTTYLRTVGVNVLLFLNGCPLPCRDAEIVPLRGLYTHFPRDERFDGDGRFADEKKRLGEILDHMGRDSLVLLNETFATTSEETAVRATVELAETLYHSGGFGVYITHQHGIGRTRIPYLHVLVDSEDENRRTYRIARQKGLSGSYAQDILRKYDLTREALARRFGIDYTAQGGGGDAAV